MFNCEFTTRFKKDYKKANKRGWNMKLFEEVYDILEQKGELPRSYKPHLLSGEWTGFVDAHIQPDWVLIYRIDKHQKSVTFVRMGTHSDLF
jgi:mRNA interferase YafQ